MKNIFAIALISSTLFGCAIAGDNEGSNAYSGDGVFQKEVSEFRVIPLLWLALRMRLVSPEGEDMGEIWGPKGFKPEEDK